MHQGQPNALNKLYSLGFSHIAAKCGMIAAKKDLAKILNGTPKTVQEVALHLHFSVPGTRKFLRTLDAFELVELLPGDLVKASALTPHLDYLLGTHIVHGYKAIDNLEFSFEKDDACWHKTFGKDFYQYIATTPGESQIFSAWCTKTAKLWLEAVARIYDFSCYKKIIDVGGNTGELLHTILAKNLLATGIVFDLPSVIDPINTSLAKNPLNERIKYISGSFFEKIPEGGDLYILSRTLLNWTDKDAITIINNCYKAMDEHAKLLILDFALPDKSSPYYQQAVLSDVNLYAVLNSSNRSKTEWSTLVRSSEFRNSNYSETTVDLTIQNELIMPICTLELSK